MVEMKIKKLEEDAINPTQANSGDAGWDVYTTKQYLIKPFETKLIGSGLAADIPKGYEIQIRSKSGIALKNSMFVLNSPATIDHGYKGEIGVILHNLKPFSQYIEKNKKIAQFVIKKVEDVSWSEVEELSNSERGEKGYGSSDNK